MRAQMVPMQRWSFLDVSLKDEHISADSLLPQLESWVGNHFCDFLYHIFGWYRGELSCARSSHPQRPDEHKEHQPVHPKPRAGGPLLHRFLRAFPGYHLHHGRVGIWTLRVQSCALYHLPDHVREHLYSDSCVSGQVRSYPVAHKQRALFYPVQRIVKRVIDWDVI